MILDMNSAMPLLATFHHWTLKVENKGDERKHSCTIWHDGKRITAYATLPVDAVKKAIYKLNRKDAPKLRLTGATQ